MEFKVKPQFFKPTRIPPPKQNAQTHNTIKIIDDNKEITGEIDNSMKKQKRSNTDEIEVGMKKQKRSNTDEIKDGLEKQQRSKPEKVSFTNDERVALRSHKLTVSDLRNMDPVKLSKTCDFPIERAKYLVAMVQFQGLGSVGPACAQYLWDVGCQSLPDVAKQDPVDLYKKLCVQKNIRMDPCMEDVFRCAVAQTRFPELPDECRNWWYWKPQRGQRHIDFKIQDIKCGKRHAT